MKKFFLGAALLAMAIFAAWQVLNVGGVSAADAPTVINPWTNGNAQVECDQVGDYKYGYKVDKEKAPNGTYSHEGNLITISNSTGKIFDWAATSKIGAVIVKAGQGVNVWNYNPQSSGDTGLYAYENKDVSHATFCWNDEGNEPDPEPEVTKPYANHVKACGKVTLNFFGANIRPNADDFWVFDYREDSEPYLTESPWKGLPFNSSSPLFPGSFDYRWNLVSIVNDGTDSVTLTYPEDSGDHLVEYRLAEGVEQDYYFDWVSVDVDSDCEVNVPGDDDNGDDDKDEDKDDKKDDDKKDESSDANDGEVLGTAVGGGQILGATTYAETGTANDLLMAMVGLEGVITTIVGTILYAKKKAI